MRWTLIGVAGLGACLALGGTAGAAGPVQAIVLVTLDDLLPTRILEVDAGTEIVFSDPRFLSLDIVEDPGAPTATRLTGGFSALFDTPGTFRFVSNVTGLERASRVPGEVIVRPRPGVPLIDFAEARPGVTEPEFRLAQEECLREPRAAGSPFLFRMCMQGHGVVPF